MIASGMMQDMVSWAVIALTPIERWSAARRLSGGEPLTYASEHWFYVVAGVALVVLIGLLWWISHQRRPISREVNRELFSENAIRRGLSSRERQILLAIVMRSGLGQSHDIFTTVDAFDRGSTKLLSECTRTRTRAEIERLKTEVAFLREKLGFRALRTPGSTGTRRPSSRDIAVGKMVEVTRRRHRGGATIRAEVVRNDDIELAIELETPAESHAGEFWRARYSFGISVWEFDTTVVSCEGGRLVLNHVDNVRFVNRRRFPRVAVTMPALVAVFPFMRRATSTVRRVPESAGHAGLGAPAFVRGMVTELAGPGLRVEAPLPVRTGDRVLIVFKPVGLESSEMTGAGADQEYIIEDVGQVRHCRPAEVGTSLAVELGGLGEADIDELVRVTNVISSKANGRDEGGEQGATVIVDHGAVVQEA